MTRTIFWSWQSDGPKRETRDLIRVALYAAVHDLAGESELVSRVEVDQDTKGVTGMALIAETVLDKIDKAVAFVGDVTPVTVLDGNPPKHLPNPNVMLELGYARKTLTMTRLIPVFNTAISGTRFEDLPFDLRHLTGSIGYALSVGAPKAELRRAREQLRKRLREKLAAMIAASSDVPIAAPWRATSPSDPSIWEEGFNPLPVAFTHQGRVDVVVAPSPRIYARLLPTAQGTAPRHFQGVFPGSEHFLKPIGLVPGGMSAGVTRDGHLVSEAIGTDRATRTLVRWYKDTGELWAISTWGFVQRGDHPHLAYDDVIKDLVRWLKDAILSSRAAGGVGPFRIRLGATGLQSVFWWQSRPSLNANLFFGLSPAVETEMVLVDETPVAIIEAVTAFFNDLTDSFGVAELSRDAVATLAATA